MKFSNHEKCYEQIAFIQVLKETPELPQWEIAEDDFPGKGKRTAKTSLTSGCRKH